MATQTSGVESPYWTEWEWHEGRQQLFRTQINHRGKVIRTQWGVKTTNQEPRYLPSGEGFPSGPDNKEPSATGNYEFGNIYSSESFRESGGQQDEITFPNSSGLRGPYAPPSPASVVPGYVNPAFSYADQVNSYGGQPGYGFPAAQNTQSGPESLYGTSSLQPAPSESQAHYGAPEQYRAQEHSVSPPYLTSRPLIGQNLQSGYMDQFSPTREQMTGPQSSYQRGSSWPSGDNKQYGEYMKQDHSTQRQKYNSGMREQNVPPGLSGPNWIPQNRVAPSGLQTSSAIPSGNSNLQEYYPSDPDKTTDSQAASPGDKGQSMYSDPQGDRLASMAVESESGEKKSYYIDGEIYATIERVSSGPAAQQQRQSKTYKERAGTSESKKESRSRSRPPVICIKTASYDESINVTAENLGNFSLHGPNRRPLIGMNHPTPPNRESKEAHKPSTRIPPPAYERPEDHNLAPQAEDMTKKFHSHRHKSKSSRGQLANSRDKGLGREDLKGGSMSWLHKNIKIHPSDQFKKGRVIITLWSEPKGSDTNETKKGEMDSIQPSRYGEEAYNSVRRFVIAKEDKGHCLCVPILTYRGQATTKQGVKADHHAIIYTGKSAPKELENEEKLVKKPIRMEAKSEKYKLDPASRINYKKIYTIEHNIKVDFIGEIHSDSKAIFFATIKRMFDESDGEGDYE